MKDLYLYIPNYVEIKLTYREKTDGTYDIKLSVDQIKEFANIIHEKIYNSDPAINPLNLFNLDTYGSNWLIKAKYQQIVDKGLAVTKTNTAIVI